MLLDGVELVVETSDRHRILFECFVRLNGMHIVVVLDLSFDNHF